MELTFKHTEESIYGCLSISEQRAKEIMAYITYSIVKQMIYQNELFDEIDDCPINLRTKSGVIEEFTGNLNNSNELAYAMFKYGDIESKMKGDDHMTMLYLMSCIVLAKKCNVDEEKFVEKFCLLTNDSI